MAYVGGGECGVLLQPEGEDTRHAGCRHRGALHDTIVVVGAVDRHPVGDARVLRIFQLTVVIEHCGIVAVVDRKDGGTGSKDVGASNVVVVEAEGGRGSDATFHLHPWIRVVVII